MKSEKNQNIFKKTEESLTKIKIQIPFFKCSILFLSMYVVPNANQMSHLGPTLFSFGWQWRVKVCKEWLANLKWKKIIALMLFVIVVVCYTTQFKKNLAKIAGLHICKIRFESTTREKKKNKDWQWHIYSWGLSPEHSGPKDATFLAILCSLKSFIGLFICGALKKIQNVNNYALWGGIVAPFWSQIGPQC